MYNHDEVWMAFLESLPEDHLMEMMNDWLAFDKLIQDTLKTIDDTGEAPTMQWKRLERL